MAESNEELIFQGPGITVSKTMVRVRGTSYPINGIGSVSVQRGDTKGALPTAILFAVGAWWTFYNYGNYGYIPAFISLGIVGAAVFPESVLVLRTASGDQRVLEARDKGFLRKIQDAIEEAVARRG